MCLVAVSKVKEKLMYQRNAQRTQQYIDNLKGIQMKLEEARTMKIAQEGLKAGEQALTDVASEVFVLFSIFGAS